MFAAAAIPAFAIPLGVLVVLLVITIVLFKSMWRVPEPNQALIISGLRSAKAGDPNDADRSETHGFKIRVGRGVFVIPGVQRVRTLNLDLHEAPLDIACVTKQAIHVHIEGVVIYKIGDDTISIGNSARRFIDQEGKMDAKVHNVFAGHMRSIIGNMSVEDLIRNREALTEQVRTASAAEIQNLGLIIDSMQILEITDPSNYITNLGAPQQAAIESIARVANAEQDRIAAEAEQLAAAQIAEATRDKEIKQAGFMAETQKAQKEAEQAGPLAEATARQAVIEQEAQVAIREAEREQQRLLATVVKPAEAAADATRTRAQADRDAAILAAEAEAAQTEKVGAANATATRLTGLAEAEVTKAKGEADGAALKARAEGLASESDAVIRQQIAGQMTDIVTAAAAAVGGIDNMVVFDGAEGVMNAVGSVVAGGATMFNALRGVIAAPEATPAPAAEIAETVEGAHTAVEDTPGA